MRSHKAVVFNFCICTTKRYGANPYYALPTRLEIARLGDKSQH
jgi:hypothetical protein